MVEARVLWKDGLRFEAHTPTGHTLILDSPKGTNAGPSPMGLMLLSLAGCTAMDVISILQKKRQPVTGFEVVVRAEQAEDHPRVYTRFEVVYVVRGDGVDRRAVERAVALSEEKYCSAAAMLRQAAPIRSSIQMDGE